MTNRFIFAFFAPQEGNPSMEKMPKKHPKIITLKNDKFFKKNELGRKTVLSNQKT